MPRLDPLDSKNAFVRAVERCMRGLAVMVITGLVALLGWLAFVLADYLLSLLPLGPMAGTVLALATGLIVYLWIIGDRTVLRTLGQMAKISDQ